MWEHFTLDLYLCLRACRFYCAGRYLNSVESEKVLKRKFLRNKTRNLYTKTFSVNPNFLDIILQIREKAEELICKMQIYRVP